MSVFNNTVVNLDASSTEVSDNFDITTLYPPLQLSLVNQTSTLQRPFQDMCYVDIVSSNPNIYYAVSVEKNGLPVDIFVDQDMNLNDFFDGESGEYRLQGNHTLGFYVSSRSFEPGGGYISVQLFAVQYGETYSSNLVNLDIRDIDDPAPEPQPVTFCFAPYPIEGYYDTVYSLSINGRPSITFTSENNKGYTYKSDFYGENITSVRMTADPLTNPIPDQPYYYSGMCISGNGLGQIASYGTFELGREAVVDARNISFDGCTQIQMCFYSERPN